MKHFYYVLVNGDVVLITPSKSAFSRFVNDRFNQLVSSGYDPEIWRRVHKFDFVDIVGNLRHFTHHYANITFH